MIFKSKSARVKFLDAVDIALAPIKEEMAHDYQQLNQLPDKDDCANAEDMIADDLNCSGVKCGVKVSAFKRLVRFQITPPKKYGEPWVTNMVLDKLGEATKIKAINQMVKDADAATSGDQIASRVEASIKG